jgi:hypothetical protein
MIDRTVLQKLFRVSPRTAVRLMNQFGGYQSGRTFLIGRENLMTALESVRAGDAFRQESRRRCRLEDDLDETRRSLRARQVKLAVASDSRSAASLPSGMRIVRSGVLEVQFGSGEELLGRLYEWCGSLGRICSSLKHSSAAPSRQSKKLSCSNRPHGVFRPAILVDGRQF